MRNRKRSSRKPKNKPSKRNDAGPSGCSNHQSGSESADDLQRLEFHRHAIALMPDPRDRAPGVAVWVDTPAGGASQRFCSCRTNRSKTCEHLKTLSRLTAVLQNKLAGKCLNADFTDSVWYGLAQVMAEGNSDTPETVSLRTTRRNGSTSVEIFGQTGDRLMTYISSDHDRSRFLERCTLSPDERSVPTRGSILRRLSLLTLTRDESVLKDMGMKTRRQALEESIWYVLAYHGYREMGTAGFSFCPAVEKTSGAFVLTCRNAGELPLFSMDIPRAKVKAVLNRLGGAMINQHGLTVSPIPLDSIFDVKLNRDLDLEIQPLLKLVQENGETRFFKRENLEKFRYGDLYYIEELGILAEDQYPAPPPKRFKDPVETVIRKSQVPEFLDEFKDTLDSGLFRIDTEVKRLSLLDTFDRIEITPDRLDRDWCWLSVRYGAGNQSISLAEILKARSVKQRFIATDGGWIDCRSSDLDPLDVLLDRLSDDDLPDDRGSVRLSRMDVLRIGAAGNQKLVVSGDAEPVAVLQKMLAFESSEPLPERLGLASPLRAYQRRGAEWLWFLFENRLGGLLCDEMGLGKTHQAMALMISLLEQEKTTDPLLVVCPTTVISHWFKKIIHHAPGLKPALYHGDQRDLERSLSDNRVLLTSYGILRRDADRLRQIPFSVAVFDEIQNLKNRDTLAYLAAEGIRARMKIGLTGTPIENTLAELKALIDLTVPGYLGTNDYFFKRYLHPLEQDWNEARRSELSRLVSPFILRRRKSTVLDELPEKIEDTMTCRLSEDQIKMYRDAVRSQGRDLMAALREETQAIPYLHIFALLNLLKQICNHPALVENAPDDYARFASGKWDLFVEILSESLESGQKVVVFSQYLTMIEIIKHHLDQRKIDFVSLTGASRNRGEIIDRFQQDPDCRVYVGSLKAGGTGIDLTAASVVIHYDRWWNAAREDQATDRVHRIGQTRGVQVFKLVTEGTLEEKIAALIDKKRRLMDSVIREDDPGLLKAFTRKELIDLLTLPKPSGE